MALDRQAVTTTVLEAFGVSLIDINRTVALIDDTLTFPDVYKLYTDLETIALEFADTTDAYKMAADYFNQAGGNGYFYLAPVRSTVVALLTLLENDPSIKFAMVTADQTTRALSEITDGTLAAAKFSKPYHMIFETDSADAITAADTDPISLNAAVYDALSGDNARLFGNMTYIYIETADDYQASAMAGQLMSQNIGTQTLKFKKPLLSVPAELTGAELAFLLAKNGNVYTGTNELTGRVLMKEGTAVKADNYTDQSLGAIWMEIQLNNAAYDLLESQKVGIDEEGFGLLESAVTPIFAQAQVQGIIQPGTGKFTIDFAAGALPREIVGTYSYVEGAAGHFITNTITVTQGE